MTNVLEQYMQMHCTHVCLHGVPSEIRLFRKKKRYYSNLIAWNSCNFCIDGGRFFIFVNSGEQLCVMCILPTTQMEIKINSNRLSMHTHTYAQLILTHSVCPMLVALFQLCLRISCQYSHSVVFSLSAEYPKTHVIESQQYHTHFSYKGTNCYYTYSNRTRRGYLPILHMKPSMKLNGSKVMHIELCDRNTCLFFRLFFCIAPYLVSNRVFCSISHLPAGIFSFFALQFLGVALFWDDTCYTIECMCIFGFVNTNRLLTTCERVGY